MVSPSKNIAGHGGRENNEKPKAEKACSSSTAQQNTASSYQCHLASPLLQAPPFMEELGSGIIHVPLLLHNRLPFSLGKFGLKGIIRSTSQIKSTFSHLLGSVLSNLTHVLTLTSKYILQTYVVFSFLFQR